VDEMKDFLADWRRWTGAEKAIALLICGVWPLGAYIFAHAVRCGPRRRAPPSGTHDRQRRSRFLPNTSKIRPKSSALSARVRGD
jgi:hypothetical protein